MKLLIFLLFVVSCEAKNPLDLLLSKEILFNGKDLNNFNYDKMYWSLDNKCIKGSTFNKVKIKSNNFIFSKKKYRDFELEVSYKLDNTSNNSGVIYRSKLIIPKNYTVKGYQGEIVNTPINAGFMYGEKDPRKFIALPGEFVLMNEGNTKHVISQVNDHKQLIDNKYINNQGWNHYKIIARGNHFIHYLNNEIITEAIDEDKKSFLQEGSIALQLHTGKAMTVYFKDVIIKPYKRNFSKAQMIDISVWQHKNLQKSTKKFKSLYTKGMQKRKNTKVNNSYTYYTFNKLYPSFKQGVLRFQMKGKLIVSNLSLESKDKFQDVEIVNLNQSFAIYTNGKFVGKVNDLEFESTSIEIRNFVVLPLN